MPRVQTFGYKLPGMRKPDNIIVYPHAAGDTSYKFQGERCIGRVDRNTGEGVLYTGKPAYGVHLAFAKPITFSREFVNMVVEYAPMTGDHVGNVLFIA